MVNRMRRHKPSRSRASARRAGYLQREGAMRHMDPNRRNLLTVLVGFACIGGFAGALGQPRPSTVARVGILSGHSRANSSTYLQLPEALLDLGWIEGKNITIEWRFANGEPADLPRLASQLVQLKPAVIVVGTNFEAEAVLAKTYVTPLVLWTALDPVGSGLARSLSHPGGSVTGLLWADPGLAAKMLDVFHEAVPNMRRVAVLYDQRFPGIEAYLDADRVTAKSISIELLTFPVSRADDVDDVLTRMYETRVDGIKIVPAGVVSARLDRVLAYSSSHRIPTIYTAQYPIERGGFLAYSPDQSEVLRRVASLVDKVLRGESPADMPFEHPTRFELTVNLRTARALGIKVPESILLRAERVIR
jgi:putative ABC transport system substrate-binding protein